MFDILARKRALGLCVVTAAVAAAAPRDVSAAAIQVYGPPAYTTGGGGYTGDTVPWLPGRGVNNSGTAIGGTTKYGPSNAFIGTRAIGWNSSGATELGSISTTSSGDSSATPYAINDAGVTVGEARKFVSDQNRGTRAVRWSPSGVATELGNLGTNSLGVTFSSAGAVNSSGTAVGYANVSQGSTNLGDRPVRWSASGTAATELGNLGTVSAGFPFASAYALTINDAGTAAGYGAKFDGSGASLGMRAIRWNASGTAATELGHIGTDANGSTDVRVSAINAAGTIVGYGEKHDGQGVNLGTRAIRWDASGTAATELGILGSSPTGVTSASAFAINDAGTAVGAAFKYDSLGVFLGERAVRWSASGTAATELGNFGTGADGAANSRAKAINSAGFIVGSASDPVLGQRATLWGPDNVAIDLNTLIDPQSGWVLLDEATAISDTGWISGKGLFDPDGDGGQDPYARLYLMQVPQAVPEPTSVASIAFAAAATLLRRRRSATN